jgi:hypothetical protein
MEDRSTRRNMKVIRSCLIQSLTDWDIGFSLQQQLDSGVTIGKYIVSKELKDSQTRSAHGKARYQQQKKST